MSENTNTSLNQITGLVKNELDKMSPQKQDKFSEIFEKKKKSKTTAYICWFFLGCHYAYMGKWKKQLAFWFTICGLGIWEIVDLFRMSKLVEECNNEIASNVLKELGSAL